MWANFYLILLFLNVSKQTPHISRVHISNCKRYLNLKSLAYYSQYEDEDVGRFLYLHWFTFNMEKRIITPFHALILRFVEKKINLH